MARVLVNIVLTNMGDDIPNQNGDSVHVRKMTKTLQNQGFTSWQSTWMGPATILIRLEAGKVSNSLHPATMFHNRHSKPVDADVQILTTTHQLWCFHNVKPLSLRVGHLAFGVNSPFFESQILRFEGDFDPSRLERWHSWHKSPSRLISVRATNATSRPLSVTMGNLPWRKWDAELKYENSL